MLASVSYFIGLHVREKRPVFHLRTQMCHVIFVSGCLTDSCRYQLILIRMAYITDRLVSICARSNVTIDIDLHVVGVVRAPRHNQIFLHLWVSNFSERAEAPLIIMMMIVITITMMIMRETFVLGPLWFDQI